MFLFSRRRVNIPKKSDGVVLEIKFPQMFSYLLYPSVSPLCVITVHSPFLQ